MPDWWNWDVRTPNGVLTDRALLRCGRDVPMDDALFFLACGYRPMRLSNRCSPDDGGVVTHSLRMVEDGVCTWSLDEDAFTQEDYIETRVRIDVAKRASIRVAERIAEALQGGV